MKQQIDRLPLIDQAELTLLAAKQAGKRVVRIEHGERFQTMLFSDAQPVFVAHSATSAYGAATELTLFGIRMLVNPLLPDDVAAFLDEQNNVVGVVRL